MGEKRRNPFQGFLDATSEMTRARELGRYGYEPGHEDRQRNHATAWVPTADVFARGEDLVIRVELAGVSREDVDITFSSGVLTISGERRSELDEKEVSFYVRERFYGVFRRSMTLPPGIDESKIDAEFDNGLVEITVRGGAAAAPRRIELKDKPR
jgi:HSP20 family protein